MSQCIFCQIANKSIPSEVIYEDSDFVAFNDINPKAPIHLLIIPKNHYSSISALDNSDTMMLGNMLNTARKIAQENDLNDSGFRLVFNSGHDAGMEIDHLHLHLLGGAKLNDIN